MRVIKAIVATFAGLASASPLLRRTDFQIKETHFVPRGWRQEAAAPEDHIINLNIALKQSNFGELERHLYEVSDPFHARYGQHLSPEDVNDLVRPSDDAQEQVLEWLASHEIMPEFLSFNGAKDWISVRLPMSTVERMLDTKYSTFTHEDGTQLVRTTAWSLPMNLHEHVQTIQPTTSFMRPRRQRRTVMPLDSFPEIGNIPSSPAALAAGFPNPAPVSQVCNNSAVTPLCLRTYYGTINYQPKATDKNSIGLTDYLGESNNRSDISLFLQKYRPDAVSEAQSFRVVVINGGSNQQTPDTPTQAAAGTDIEGDLDAETIIGFVYPTKLTAYTTGGMPPFQPDILTPTDTNEPYMDWLNYVLSRPNGDVPQVISNSYADEEQSVPLSYAQAVCNGFAQLGARGKTILFGSGDDGVGPNGTCVANSFAANPGKPAFLPFFPASCPYVTTVGATKNFNPEVAAYDPRNGFASGGGFSNYFARPSYQNGFIPAYIASLGGEFNGLYNKSGRGFPDISAAGQSYVEVWFGRNILVDGTSASTPTTASIVSLVNDALLAAGKPPLGFLNPFIYSRAFPTFNDVTSGSAIGCNGSGFPARPGWDAVTGFGTPRFQQLMEVALFSSGFKET